MTKGARVWTVLLVCAVLVVGCGDVPTPRRPNAPHGVAREYMPIDLPWAAAASAPRLDAATMYDGEWEPGERQVLNVLPPAEVVYKQTVVDLAEDAEPALLVGPLIEHLAAVHERYRNERDAFVLLLHADKDVLWGVARAVLDVGLRARFRFHELHIACRSPGLAGDVRVEFPVERVAAPPEGMRLHLLRTGSGAYRLDRRRGDRIERTFALPAADPADEFVRRQWFGPHLQDVLEGRRIVPVSFDDAVPLQFVLSLLDVLREAGASAVVLADLDVELWMRAQDPGEPWSPEPDRPLGPAGGVAIALLALLAGWLVWRARRSIGRGSPGRTPSAVGVGRKGGPA